MDDNKVLFDPTTKFGRDYRFQAWTKTIESIDKTITNDV
jgi:hypothetical protein